MDSLFKFPPLSTEDYNHLKADIAERGVLVPVQKLLDGRIIDGLHRLKACEELGIDAKTEILQISEDEALERAITLNLARRHLSHEQKKEIIAALRGKGWSQERVARVIGFTRQRIDQLENINNANICTANNPAPPDIRYKLKKEHKQQIKKSVQEGKTQEQVAADYGITQGRVSQILSKKELERKQTAPNSQALIKHQSYSKFFEEISQIDVDLLITDPPYMTEFKDEQKFYNFVYEWINVALSKIKSSGRAFIFIGSYPLELSIYTNSILAHEKKMIFEDILVWTYKNTIGPRPSQTYIRNWQAILHLRGKDSPPLNNDSILEQLAVQEFNAPDGRHGERFCKFQKPLELARRLISHATEPNAVIIDPFAGSGTFLLAAVDIGRQAFGCDNSREAIEIAIERGCKLEF